MKLLVCLASVVIEQAGTNLRPRLSVKDDSGKTAKFAVQGHLLGICFQ